MLSLPALHIGRTQRTISYLQATLMATNPTIDILKERDYANCLIFHSIYDIILAGHHKRGF